VTEHAQLTMEPVKQAHGPGYVAMVDEFEATGEGYGYNNVPLARSDFAAFVRELDEEAAGIGLPPGIPPQQTYVLVRDDTDILGEFRLRPVLEEPYERFNGHIGYNLRPSARGKGYGTKGLALLLDHARTMGVPGVLLTIEDENPGSVRVIEKNGGTLLRQSTDPDSGEVVSSYWIDLA
jgi:predicted acetyltransferase